MGPQNVNPTAPYSKLATSWNLKPFLKIHLPWRMPLKALLLRRASTLHDACVQPLMGKRGSLPFLESLGLNLRAMGAIPRGPQCQDVRMCRMQIKGSFVLSCFEGSGVLGPRIPWTGYCAVCRDHASPIIINES